MADETISTVPRRQLGRLLRDARKDAGITLDGAADALEYSRQKIWRIESGLGPVRTLDVKAMCDLYGVAPEMVDVLTGLAAETKSKGWWHAYGDAIPQWFELFVGLEASASRMRRYDESLVPGLLQTPDYARAIYRLDRPTLGDEERERAIAVRLHRQGLLTRRLPPAPRLDVVISEAALRRTIRDRNAMVEQLRHLLAVWELPNVSLRVLPLAAGPHRGAVAGGFVLLDFPQGNGRGQVEPSTVYAESITGGLYLDKPDEVAVYGEIWASLEALALDGGESKKMITQVIGEIHNE
jgi:transcriptional regulator with XRE-family HTH domain